MARSTDLPSWLLRLPIVILLGMTLPFKFSGAAEPVALFTQLSEFITGSDGLQAPMRLGTAVLEALAVILVLIPGTTIYGALLALALMGGAIVSHILVLGYDDLFIYALIVSAAAAVLAYRLRLELPFINK